MLTVTNDGETAHNLAIRGTDLVTADLPAGGSDQLDLSGLDPGTYEWYCTIGGHEAAGMAGSLQASESDGAGHGAAGGDGVTFVSQEPIEPGDAMDYTFVAEEVMITNDAGNIGFSLNGKSFPATTPYTFRSGDRVLVHYANEGQMAYPMHLHNQDGTVIAKDGYLLPEGARYQGDTFNVAPGERLSVVYDMDEPGTWVWHCHILSHVKKADGTMFGMLTAVTVED